MAIHRNDVYLRRQLQSEYPDLPIFDDEDAEPPPLRKYLGACAIVRVSGLSVAIRDWIPRTPTLTSSGVLAAGAYTFLYLSRVIFTSFYADLVPALLVTASVEVYVASIDHPNRTSIRISIGALSAGADTFLLFDNGNSNGITAALVASELCVFLYNDGNIGNIERCNIERWTKYMEMLGKLVTTCVGIGGVLKLNPGHITAFVSGLKKFMPEAARFLRKLANG